MTLQVPAAGIVNHVEDHKTIHAILNGAGVSVTDPAYGAVGDGSANDTDAINDAIDAAEALGTAHSTNNTSNAPGETPIVYVPPGIYLTTGVDLNGKNVALRGAGPASTRFRAHPSTTGFVVDMDDWAGDIAHFRGESWVGGFSIEGLHAADATKTQGGLTIENTVVALRDISIMGTGGPGLYVGPVVYLSEFDNITIQRPVGADTNDVPYLHIFGSHNGNVWRRLGLTSVSPDPDGTKVVFVELNTGAASIFSAMCDKTAFIDPWLEHQAIPENGAAFWMESSQTEIRNLQAFDVVSSVDNPTDNALVRFKDTAAAAFPGSAIGTNRWTGLIPGRGTAADSLAYGAIIEGDGNYVVGVRGFRNNNVLLASGVDDNHIELVGVDSASGAVDDDSGTVTNRIIGWSEPTPTLTLPSLKIVGDLGFFGATPVSQPSALTTEDASAVNSGDATTDAVIDNIRTRLGELEANLQDLGLNA